MQKNHFNIVLGNFLVAAVMGATLRFAFVEEIPWLKFRYFLHGHSHLAMLGWAYLALFILLLRHFLDSERRQKRTYVYLFWATQVTVIGMTIAFPIQGYAAVSIAFSTIHVLASYFFAYHFLRDLSLGNHSSSIARRFIRAAIFFMILSTLALWALGPIMVLGQKGSAWYYMAVQFFLHFQFNGWFLFAVLGLFFKFLEDKAIPVPISNARWFFRLLFAANLATYALAVAWAKPLLSVFMVNSLGVTLQLAALFFFVPIVWQNRSKILPALRLPEGGIHWPYYLLPLAFYAFLLKILMQTALVIPAIAKVGYTIRNFVIGFMHLILLLVVSVALLAFARQARLIGRNRWIHTGLALLLSGMLLSEALLFLQGTLLWAKMGFLPGYYEVLFGFSALMPLGLVFVLIGNLLPEG
jgi:hypothetical protein